MRTQLLLTLPALVVAAHLLTAADARAQVVFSEDFEVPDTTNFITFFAPQQIVTASNTWQVVAESVDLVELRVHHEQPPAAQGLAVLHAVVVAERVRRRDEELDPPQVAAGARQRR